MLRKQGFHPRWREITQEELSANMYGGREIDLVGIFSIFLLNDYGLGNQFIEVVHGKSGKDFLVNELHLFCVKMLEPDGVFQFTERGFNPPAHGILISSETIAYLHCGNWKSGRVQQSVRVAAKKF